MNKKITHIFFAASFLIPLGPSENWQNLKFSKIPENKVEFVKNTIRVYVNKSASPLIYPLSDVKKVSGMKIKGRVSQMVPFAKASLQGEKKQDDAVLRFGMVIPGDRKLNWATRLVAADWVKRLHDLAPPNSGIDHVLFLKMVQSENLKGFERVHPMSELIRERNEWLMTSPGDFELSAEFQAPLEVAALWLSIDGDDTQSQFTVEIQHIELNLAAEN